MLCPKCGFNSFDYYANCPKCRKDWTMVRRQLLLTSPEPGPVDFFASLSGSEFGSKAGEAEPTGFFPPDLDTPPPTFGQSQDFLEAEAISADSPYAPIDPIKTIVPPPPPLAPPSGPPSAPKMAPPPPEAPQDPLRTVVQPPSLATPTAPQLSPPPPTYPDDQASPAPQTVEVASGTITPVEVDIFDDEAPVTVVQAELAPEEPQPSAASPEYESVDVSLDEPEITPVAAVSPQEEDLETPNFEDLEPEPSLPSDSSLPVEPIFEASPEPTPALDAEPVFDPEPTIDLEPSFDPEPTIDLEPSFDPEPTIDLEPSFDPEPTIDPEPTFDPEPAFDPEPIVAPPAPRPSAPGLGAESPAIETNVAIAKAPPSPPPPPQIPKTQRVKMEAPEITASIGKIRESLTNTGDLPTSRSPMDPTETFMVNPGSLEVLAENDDTHSLGRPAEILSQEAPISVDEDFDLDGNDGFESDLSGEMDFGSLDDLDDDE